MNIRGMCWIDWMQAGLQSVCVYGETAAGVAAIFGWLAGPRLTSYTGYRKIILYPIIEDQAMVPKYTKVKFYIHNSSSLLIF